MLRKSIGVGLLCLAASHAFASIEVTTTEDVVKDDDVCSLREAITYVNEYISDEDKKAAGYNGCGGSSATSTILLESNKTYVLDDEVSITAAVTIQTNGTNVSTDTASIGVNNATIKANGNHRLFIIDDGNTDIGRITVSFTQINLQGCGTTTVCEDRGGIIYNREFLTIGYAKVFQGYANLGGAIYNDGLVAGGNSSSAGSVVATNSIFTENKAKTGAVIYTAQPLFGIQKSVIRNNTVSNSSGALIYSANAFSDETTGTTDFSRESFLVNSTLFKNTGYLLNVRDGVYVNNVTAVANSKGIYFDAPLGKAHIANSILVSNNDQDCAFSADDDSESLNNLVGDTCPKGESGNYNTYLSAVTDNQLFAGDSSEGTCDHPPADGLLCPYYTPKGAFLGFFKPRLLTTYTSLTDSPIVNRGRLYSNGTSESTYSCESTDQRGLSRTNSVHCDLGAIELVVSAENISRVGQDIFYGETATMSIIDSLADGELLPASECQAVLGSAKDPNGDDWKIGCLRVEQSVATPTSKGSLTLDEDGNLVYTPDSNWHGSDEFDLKIVTTASRFSEAEADRDIIIPVRIVQSPPDNFKSDKIKVSGGSFGWLSVLSLFVLALRRRTKA